MLHRLQLVKNQIGFSLPWDLPADVIIKSKVIRKVPITQGFQIHMDNVVLFHPLLQQILMVKLQQRGLPASADAGNDFDLAVPHITNEPVQIIVALNHFFHLELATYASLLLG